MDSTYRRLLLIQSLLALANATAAVFGVVFLLKREGFTVQDLVLFNLVEFAVAAGACVALVRVRPRRGGALLVLGLAFLLASYVLFLVLRDWPLLLAVAIAWGLFIPLFFLPFNALFVATTRAEDRAGKIGGLILAYTAVAILAPSLGGAIVRAAGYDVLFAFAVGVLVIDLGLVLRMQLGREPLTLAFDFRSLGARTGLALFAEGGFEGFAFGAIPLVAFSFTTEEVGLGALFSLFALAGGLVAVTLGVASDRLRHRRPFLVAGAASSALAAILVARALSLAEFAVANTLVSLTSSIAPMFLLTIVVERFPGHTGSAIVTREVLLNAGRAVSLAALLLLVAVGVSVQHAFVLAAVSLAFVALGDARPAMGCVEPAG